MNTNEVVSLPESPVSMARHEVVSSSTSAYGAMVRYAGALNTEWPDFAWYEVAHNDAGGNAKLVHTEKKALFAELKEAKHSNPSTIWARVRAYGKEAREGKPEEEGNGAKANEGRSPMVRNLEELIALYKFNQRQDELPQKVIAAQGHIKSALLALGADLNAI